LHFGFPSWKTHDPPLRHFKVHTAGVFVGSMLVSQRTPVKPLGQKQVALLLILTQVPFPHNPSQQTGGGKGALVGV